MSKNWFPCTVSGVSPSQIQAPGHEAWRNAYGSVAQQGTIAWETGNSSLTVRASGSPPNWVRIRFALRLRSGNVFSGIILNCLAYMHTCIHTYIHYINYIHTLHYITLHGIALHCIALHCIALHCIPLHYITYIHT